MDDRHLREERDDDEFLSHEDTRSEDEVSMAPDDGVPDPERSYISDYLCSHPDFAREWFTEFAGQDMVQEWLTVRGLTNNDLWSLHDQNDHEKLLSDSYAEVARGSRNSVTSELFRRMMTKKRKRRMKHTHEKLSRVQREMLLERLDEHDTMMEFIRDIANELDIDTLCHKILVNVCILTKSDRASLFLAKGSRGKRYLAAKLFDVTSDSVLEEAIVAAEQQTKIRPIPFGVGIVGHVAETKETVNIKDAYQDSRFNKEIDARTGYRTVSIMCMPVLNFHGDVIGVAQCINKASDEQAFTEQDEEVFKKYLTFCGIGIQNAQLFEMSVQEYKRNQVLLSLAQSIFEETSSLDSLIYKIMVKAQGLLHCHKCRVYLVDTEHVDKISYLRNSFDGNIPKVCSIFKPRKFSKPEDVTFTTIFELRNGENELQRPSLGDGTGPDLGLAHFARHVAATGQTFNWTGEESEREEFKQLMEWSTSKEDFGDFCIGHVVSIPIFNSEGKVIGVAQLVNKLNGEPFLDIDISTFEAFSIFCGLGIHNTLMYENAIKLMAKQRVALEVLSYHASSALDETQRLMNADIPSAENFNLYGFDFSDFCLSGEDTCQAVIRMFLEMELIATFHIPYQVLCRWVLTVRKNYRPVIYHNWRHALNVTQTMFAMVTTGGMRELMTELEILALLVACLSHDLDHRGTNNSFQTKISSPLATLYSTSTMEHHHFDHCIMILNSEGNNILQSLSPEKYREAIHIIEGAILSTDLALYFKKKDRFVDLMASGEVNWKLPENMNLLRGMMMTACDVSAICKPWNVQRQVAELVASEFFEQGDLEKERLKEKPIAMMDREKKDELPKMQVHFIDCICIPVYRLLAEQWPKLMPLYEGCQKNRTNWQDLHQSRNSTEGTVNGVQQDKIGGSSSLQVSSR